MKKVLILGAGYVSGPVVEYLNRDDRIAITIVSNIKEHVDRVSATGSRTKAIHLDITQNADDAEKLISNSDIVISLLPAPLHPGVAKLCIKHTINMVTCSYLSPPMMELHKSAEDAGIIIMNEVGVDPGIDHMLAVECFDRVKEQGGKIISYACWCGGLPAPEFSDNPLRYKFSWSPKAVLTNVLGGAKYLDDGKVQVIKPGELLTKGLRTLTLKPGFNIEGFPNKDSTTYADLYGIQTVKSLIRGIIRYTGFSAACKALADMGLFDSVPHARLNHNGPDITWKEFLCELMGKKEDISVQSLGDCIIEKFGKSKEQLQCLTDLGLLDDQLVEKYGNPVDTISNYLARRLAFDEGERDLLLLQTDVGVEWSDGNQEVRHINFAVYGDPDGFSAVAKTVGLPTAMTAKMILAGEIQAKGMQLPLCSDIYRPLLTRLKEEGIAARETITK